MDHECCESCLIINKNICSGCECVSCDHNKKCRDMGRMRIFKLVCDQYSDWVTKMMNKGGVNANI